MDAEEKKFLKYQAATGGEEPLGLIVPFGYPPGVEDYGGVIPVYDECIKRGITWEKLLGWNPPPDALI